MSSISIVEANSAEALQHHVAHWHELAVNAIDANVFYEPGAFLAAINNVAGDYPYAGLFIYADIAGESMLIGFFPYLRTRKGPRNQVTCFQSFTHLHCFLCTPLLHKSHASEALNGFFDWLDDAASGTRLFGLYKVNNSDGFGRILAATLADRGQPFLREHQYERALLSLKGDLQSYLASLVNRHRRKEYRRLRNRLQELGAVHLETATHDDADGNLTERFLRLEASGWKGSRGLAMDNDSADAGYFYDLVSHLGEQNRLLLHTLWVGDKPIAMKCNLLSADGQGSFAFKIAYDEDYSRFSPGVLLELDNMEDLFDRAADIQWMDSCAAANHPMIDHLWRERRRIGFILCGSRDWRGRLLVKYFKWRQRRAKKLRGGE